MRTLGLSCLLCAALLLPACGNVFVSGSWTGRQTTSGIVTIVQFTIVSNGNTQVTVVTFANGVTGTSQTFCGDQRTQFPLNDFVLATFTPGPICSNLFSVEIMLN